MHVRDQESRDKPTVSMAIMAAANKSPTKFAPADWHTSNFLVSSSAERQRAATHTIRQENHRLSNDTGALFQLQNLLLHGCTLVHVAPLRLDDCVVRAHYVALDIRPLSFSCLFIVCYAHNHVNLQKM